MITKRIILAALALTIALVSPVTAQMYQYTDKNGHVVFTDRPPVGSNAGEVKLNSDRVSRSAPRRYEPSPPTTSAPVEEQRRKRDYGDVSVVMYMTSW
jgi:Domain of unknown function (DUF4124)